MLMWYLLDNNRKNETRIEIGTGQHNHHSKSETLRYYEPYPWPFFWAGCYWKMPHCDHVWFHLILWQLEISLSWILHLDTLILRTDGKCCTCAFSFCFCQPNLQGELLLPLQLPHPVFCEQIFGDLPIYITIKIPFFQALHKYC